MAFIAISKKSTPMKEVKKRIKRIRNDFWTDIGDAPVRLNSWNTVMPSSSQREKEIKQRFD
jgi:hypothetical protein